MSQLNGQTSHDELTRLEILRVFKKRFAGELVNDSPFAERIVKFADSVEDWDVPEIHHNVRLAIETIIKEIQAGQASKIVILAGDAGMGKSHLLNYFCSPRREQELGYVLIGNSNQWKVEEFEAYLLDSILDALLKPSPQQPHLLLDKIQSIAFEALRQILDRPGQLRRFVGRKDAGFWQRLWGRLFGSGAGRFQKAVVERNANIFRRLHFATFADYVIERFLPVHASKPFHRHVLKCLLLYIFPEEREKVIQWLRRQPVEQHFVSRLGIGEKIDKKYQVIDTIHILISLFSPEVSRMIHPQPPQSRGLVFFFAFDQMEGREEALFDLDSDWNTFFGKLSNLYNILPNVFFMFTMTLGLREKLYPKMEKQFQHRIQRDQKYVLREIQSDEILAIYRRRVARWLGDANAQTQSLLKDERFRYLPFRAEEVIEFGRPQAPASVNQGTSLRDILERMDQRFRDYLDTKVVMDDPQFEYLVTLNELREKARSIDNAFNFTKDHLANTAQLMNRAGGMLSSLFDIRYSGMEEVAVADTSLRAIRLEFRHPIQEAEWVRVFVVRLASTYTKHVEGCIDLLFKLQTEKNFLWLVRPERIDATIESRRPGQIYVRVLPTDWECTLQAMLRLLDKREQFQEAVWKQAECVLGQEFRQTYLGEMFQDIAGKLGVDPVSSRAVASVGMPIHEEIKV